MSASIFPWSTEVEAVESADVACRGVLVVEDDLDAAANLTDILELEGYQVRSAASAAEALGQKNWEEIAIIVLDRHLPDGDAVALVPRLRSIAPHSAIVIVTGQADFEGAIAAMRNGAADYILKPVNAELLLAALARIIERQRFERSLSESRARRRQEQEFVETLLDTAPSFVILLDARGRIQRFNTAWSELTGYDLAELRGHHVIPFFFTRDEAIRLGPWFSMLANEGSVTGVNSTVRCRDGHEIEVRWSAKMLHNDQGKAIAVLASGQDISELKQAQELALQSERLAAIGQTMAGLVHESRNALQRSCACAEMLALDIADRPQAMQLLTRIQKAQNDLHQLFEEVREYAAPLRLDRRPADLMGICRSAWQNLQTLHEAKQLEWQESATSGKTMASVDSFAFEQVARNLLENAIHAAPQASKIHVRVEPATIDGRNWQRVVVRDEGAGFPAGALPRVREPFYTTKTKGTGLGLAIVQRIVLAHGGRLHVGNGSSGGAEVVVEIPGDTT